MAKLVYSAIASLDGTSGSSCWMSAGSAAARSFFAIEA